MTRKDEEIIEKKDIVKCVERIIEEVESVWNKELTEYSIRVIPAKKFLIRLQIMDQEINRLLPPEKRKEIHSSSPGAITYCSKKEILIPDKYIARFIELPESMRLDPYDPKIRKMKAKQKYLRWKRPVLESVVAEEVSHLIFRQERGEAGKREYTDYITNCSKEALSWIAQTNEVLAQYIGEKILISPEHAPIVLRDRIISLWTNSQRRETYKAIQALNQHYPIDKLASFDTIVLPPGMVETTPQIIAFLMFDEHPTYQRRFEYVKDIWQRDILP